MTVPGEQAAPAAAWRGWVGVLRGHGWGVDAVLRAPVDPAALAGAERAVGMPQPDAPADGVAWSDAPALR